MTYKSTVENLLNWQTQIRDTISEVYRVIRFNDDITFICYFDLEACTMRTLMADSSLVPLNDYSLIPIDAHIAFGQFAKQVSSYMEGIGDLPASNYQAVESADHLETFEDLPELNAESMSCESGWCNKCGNPFQDCSCPST